MVVVSTHRAVEHMLPILSARWPGVPCPLTREDETPMFAVQFGTFEHLYGRFPSVAKASWWARTEGDGSAYSIHKIAAEPKPTPAST
jgi:hypothetical protein